jgi:hypothetical protein
MIRNILNSVGGRGFVFAIMAFWITTAFAQWGSMEWDQWVHYNTWIGSAMLGAKAVEGAASVMRNGK